jgi:LuxR family transcriptional regulator, maltose regulon positive regulatory protein
VSHPVLDELRRGIDEALVTHDVGAAVAAIRPRARAVAAEEGAAFRRLIARLPDEAWHDDAIIASAMGASFRAAGSPRGSSAIGYFHAAEIALTGADPTESDHSRDPERIAILLGRAAALRAVGQLEAAGANVDKAYALDRVGSALPVAVRVELGARGALERGMIELHLGNIDAAARHLAHAHGLAPQNLSRAEQIECLGGLALVDYVQSEFDSVLLHVVEARALAAGTTLSESGFAAPVLVAEVLVAIDRHDLGTAADLESSMLTAARPGDFEPFAYAVAGYRRLAERRFPEALDFLQRSRQGFRTWEPRGLGSAIEEVMRAGILVHLNQSDEAWGILRDLEPFEHHVVCPARVIAQLRFGHGDLKGAAEALIDCEKLGDDHSPRTLIEVRLLRAAIEFERGEFAISDSMFDCALVTMARTGGRAPLRTIQPGTLRGLAERAMTRPQDAEVSRILGRILQATDGVERLVEPLSHRELLVLAEVEKGSTVGGIAAALYISPNTVKTHLRRLYRKLGVTTRADAIRKATSLGLGR